MSYPISLIAPIYNESSVIDELVKRLFDTIQSIPGPVEVIFIDDGSSDDSVEKIRFHMQKYSWISLIELSRNFGHQYAVSAGLNFATGSIVAIIDGDLQDPPELIPEMIKKIDEGYDVVYGIRATRKENILKRCMYYFFYRFLYLLTDIWIPADAGDFCVISARVLDEMRKVPERNRFLRGIRAWVGFKQIGFPYDRHERHSSKSKYSLSKLLHLGLDGIFGFSLKPLRMIFLLGVSLSFFALLIALYYIYLRAWHGLSPPGFTSVMVSLLLLGGVQFAILGIIGEYIGRIYQEVKQRPLYVVKSITRGSDRQ